MENIEAESFELPVKRGDTGSIGSQALAVKKKLGGFFTKNDDLRRLGVCIFEAEANLAIHTSAGGVITITLLHNAVRVTARDTGPGIADMEKALTMGYSTAPVWARELGFGSGMGLKNIRRVADFFDIKSSPKGTEVVFEVRKHAS
jgi:anti-sigma regulatory factor (Ser/Thr protein kinase)